MASSFAMFQINKSCHSEQVAQSIIVPFGKSSLLPRLSVLSETGWIILDFIWSMLHPLLVPILFILRLMIEATLFSLNHPLPVLNVSIATLSTTAHQIDLRLHQLSFWPYQYYLWSTSKNKLTAKAQAMYIGVFNTLWLVVNDIIVGFALRSLIIEHRVFLANVFAGLLKEYTINYTKSMIGWLMGWPAGLKLNSELNSFLGELFGWIILSWDGFLDMFFEHLPIVLLIVGECSVLGASMTIAITGDIITLATIHLQLFYTISAKIYFWQLSALHSLFMLFQGKKRNALRNRIDSAEYDLDQLLLGTCFFTLLVFLFPTVAVYYVLFCLTRIAFVALHAVGQIVLAILNHFPLFALMLRFKDPMRLPESIRLDVCSSDAIEEGRDWARRFYRRKTDTSISTSNQTKQCYLYLHVSLVFAFIS